MPRADGTLGDKRQPNKLIKYLLKKNISFQIDKNQQNRRTEYVLLTNSITENNLKRAISKSGAIIEYHTSKNTYHISAKNVNKGSAIAFLTGGDELSLDSTLDEVIAIGDSDLDFPMFKHADRSYLVGKPDNSLAKKIKGLKKKVIQLPLPPDALDEMYGDLFPLG